MNAPATDLPTAEDLAAALPPEAPRRRRDGWTPPRQRAFLEAVAAGCTIREACGRVGLSPASLYAFRNSPAGGGFALGWDAASLRARGALHDVAIARVVEGYEERVTRANGEVIVRHRHDNRLLLRVLERLDRHAAFDGPGTLAAARTIERDFGRYLDGICHPNNREDVATNPVGADLADLVLADRADWTADEWRRAEAAGLLSFAAPAMDEVEQQPGSSKTAFERQVVQHRGERQPGQGSDLDAQAAGCATASGHEVERPPEPNETAFERQFVQHRREPQPEAPAKVCAPPAFDRSGAFRPDRYEGAAFAGPPILANRAARRASAARRRGKELVPQIASLAPAMASEARIA